MSSPVFSFGVRLHRRAALRKSGSASRGGDDTPDGRHRVERAVEAPGIEDLRRQAAISQRRRIAMAEAPVRGVVASNCSTARRPASPAVAVPASFCSWLAAKCLPRYCRTRRLLTGWMSQAMVCASARTRPVGSRAGSSGGS